MSNSSIWPMDRTLSGATTPGPSGPGSDDREPLLCIPQRSSISEASPSDCLMSYLRCSLGGLSIDAVSIFCCPSPRGHGCICVIVDLWVAVGIYLYRYVSLYTYMCESVLILCVQMRKEETFTCSSPRWSASRSTLVWMKSLCNYE